MSISKSKRILVTGGAGFLGANLCKELLEQGNHVVCLDNFKTSSKENVTQFQHNKFFKFVEHDIIDPIRIEGIDEIYNLACAASPPMYQKDPVHTLKTNVLGALNVLELARNNNARVLQASTSEIYGNPLVHPQTESYFGNVNPIGPRACYDEGKRCAETLFFDYFRKYSLEIKVARIFNTYGPFMDVNDGRVISNFIAQALKGDDITIYGDGTQTRSFCYVDDLVSGLIRLMNSPTGITGPVNLGNSLEYSIAEVAEIVVKIVGANSNIIYLNLPEDDPQLRRPSLHKAKELIDWQPATSFETGLKKTVAHFKNILSS